MVKKSISSPLIPDDEVDELVKASIKREKKSVKPLDSAIAGRPKAIEKIKPIPMEKPKPKPVKKEVKREQEKIVKAIKSIEPVKPETKIEVIKTPEIEYEFKKVTRFDLNWYYVKEKFVKFKKWLISPYRHYENWFNKTFNSPSDKDVKELLEIFEDIPKLEQKIHTDANNKSKERIRKLIIKGVEK